MASIFYSCMILTFLCIIYFAFDYMAFSRKKKKMEFILTELSIEPRELPLADNSLERDYQEMILSLYREMKKNLAVMETEHQEQMEYYTMWVHQIKTPISAMELSLKNIKTPESRVIEGELFKIEQYVEMALHYVKMKNLSSDLVIREYEVSGIVKASVKKYASLFINKKLSVSIDPVTMYVRTDSKWLSFLIEQLLSNAIKYTNEGGIYVRFAKNTLIIEDTGIGIREEDKERIFEKGYTGYNGRIDKKASGIGLYLVKKVSESLAIKIRIESKLGKGTKVILSFPDSEKLDFE
ncbi:hypothetical protein SAMN02745217_00779 [Anaerocolumna xylanovorans DSM 12503]|uniref:histidine kinase n=2 Tax=Anaerocolumna TaxID=1843210 RepID=A0A1M7Y064_9FIRM|nr:hypothetical protein SAMN02745217_00779 [Anaerocolumna xylanovorans DSM 12503]